MPVVVITPPAPIVSLEEARAHLRVEHDDDDAVITGLIAAAQGTIDGPLGWLGRAIGPQTLEAYDLCMDRWGRFALPCPPVVSLTTITGIDGTVAAGGVFSISSAGLLSLAVGQSWPWASWSGIRVRYQAGYSVVPPPIKTAVLMMMADLYEYRGAKVANTLLANPTVKALLAPYLLQTL